MSIQVELRQAGRSIAVPDGVTILEAALAAAPATDAVPTTEATGSIDRPRETSLCAWALPAATSRALAHNTAAVVRRRWFMSVSLDMMDSSGRDGDDRAARDDLAAGAASMTK